MASKCNLAKTGTGTKGATTAIRVSKRSARVHSKGKANLVEEALASSPLMASELRSSMISRIAALRVVLPRNPFKFFAGLVERRRRLLGPLHPKELY